MPVSIPVKQGEEVEPRPKPLGPRLLIEYGPPHPLLGAVVLQPAPGAASRLIAEVAAVVRPGEIHRCLLKLLHVSFLSLTEVSTHHSHTSHAQL